MTEQELLEKIDAFHPTTEAIARSVAARNKPTSAHQWELPQLPAPQDDPHERKAVNRLIEAARQAASRGAIDHDTYICSAEQGAELRDALASLDSLRDREAQRGDEDELWDP